MLPKKLLHVKIFVLLLGVISIFEGSFKQLFHLDDADAVAVFALDQFEIGLEGFLAAHLVPLDSIHRDAVTENRNGSLALDKILLSRLILVC